MQLTREQTQSIIDAGKAQGLNGKDVFESLIKKGYQPEGYTPPQEQTNMINTARETFGDFKGVGQDILASSQGRADNMQAIGTAQATGEQGTLRSNFQRAGQIAGAGADAIGAVAKGAVNTLLSDKTEKDITDVISNFGAKVMANKTVQGIINKYNGLSEEQQRDVDAVGGIVALVGEFVGVGVAQRGASVAGDAIGAGIKTTKKVATEAVDSLSTISTSLDNVTNETFKIGSNILPKSPEIMNKVARLTPTQARKFESIAGMSHGEYLAKTGNFNSPDKILTNEASKFAQSIIDTDQALASLNGTFKNGVVDDVLEGLTQKVNLTSSPNVPSPISAQVSQFIAKHADEGLTMSEINAVKRLYEREVKLSFNKLTSSNDLVKATNIDSALRKWQFETAESLGFTNLKEMNKQTQISKQLINSLGDQVVGKTGLNDLNLTDWIMLSGGDPTAVGGFLTKRLFSNKTIQARIARFLSDAVPDGAIKPKLIKEATLSKQTQPLLPKI